jgi:PAS domain S-box-containing protein
MADLREALQASPDAVLLVDDAGVIRWANRNVPSVLGFSPAELEGTSVEELLLEKDREAHVRFRREYMDSPEPRPMGRDLDLYALHEDGTTVPVEISLGPIEREGERFVVATIAEISERKRRERELQRQNERLEEFASIVSHDLQGPLRVIEGRLRLAREECDSEHLDAIESSVDRMNELIEDLLRLAQEGNVVEAIEPVDLPGLVEDCWRNVGAANATLVAETTHTVRADRTRLQQLLANLLTNAVDHAGTDATVTVGGLDDGFYVADDGPGIPTEDRDRVFERGYSTGRGGTGFGLAIVEQIADAHDWTVRVTDSDDGGTRFEVTGIDVVDA